MTAGESVTMAVVVGGLILLAAAMLWLDYAERERARYERHSRRRTVAELDRHDRGER